MKHLTVNFLGKVRTASLGGKDYLVAPMTMLVEGVLDGSKGPLLYEEQEITRDISMWNGMPIVVNHPYENGRHISARRPDILDKQGIGFVFNADYQNKLIAEAWFDIAATQRIEPSILERLKAGERQELSTGLLTTDIKAPEGVTFNGVAYTHKAVNLKADHLAVLVGAEGACSIKDGCGVLVNKKNDESLFKRLTNWITANQGKADSEIEAELSNLGYVKSRVDVSLAPEPVKREVNFVPTTNSEEEPKEMAKLTEAEKKDIVDSLVGNCAGCPQTDRETFNKLSDDVLSALKVNADKAELAEEAEIAANAAKNGVTDQSGNKYTFNGKTGQWEVKASKKKVVTANKQDEVEELDEDQWLNKAPSGIRSAVANAMRIEAQEKGRLIGELTAHLTGNAKQNYIDKLSSKSLEDLNDIMSLRPSKTEKTNEEGSADFYGQQGSFSLNSRRKQNQAELTANERKDVLEDLEIDYEELASA